MAGAAFVVAVLALVVSAWAAHSAFRSSRAAREVAERDADRRHEERTPSWTFTVANARHVDDPRLLAGRLTSSESVDTVEVTITEGGVLFAGGQEGVIVVSTVATRGPVAGGAAAVWRVTVASGPTRTVRLSVRSTRAGDQPWDTVETLEVPGDTLSIW